MSRNVNRLGIASVVTAGMFGAVPVATADQHRRRALACRAWRKRRSAASPPDIQQPRQTAAAAVVENHCPRHRRPRPHQWSIRPPWCRLRPPLLSRSCRPLRSRCSRAPGNPRAAPQRHPRPDPHEADHVPPSGEVVDHGPGTRKSPGVGTPVAMRPGRRPGDEGRERRATASSCVPGRTGGRQAPRLPPPVGDAVPSRRVGRHRWRKKRQPSPVAQLPLRCRRPWSMPCHGSRRSRRPRSGVQFWRAAGAARPSIRHPWASGTIDGITLSHAFVVGVCRVPTTPAVVGDTTSSAKGHAWSASKPTPRGEAAARCPDAHAKI